VTCPVSHFWKFGTADGGPVRERTGGQEGSQFISQLGTECRNLAGMKGFSYKATFCLPRSASLSSTLPFHHLHHAVPRDQCYGLAGALCSHYPRRNQPPLPPQKAWLRHRQVKSGMLSLHIMIALRLAAFVSEIVLIAEEVSGNFNLSALFATIICIGAAFLFVGVQHLHVRPLG